MSIVTRVPGRRVVQRVLRQVVEDRGEVLGRRGHHRRRRPAPPCSSCPTAPPALPAPAAASITSATSSGCAAGRSPPPARVSSSDSRRASRSVSCSAAASSRSHLGSRLFSAAASSRSRSPVSGVRSWCDAFATNSRCPRRVRGHPPGHVVERGRHLALLGRALDLGARVEIAARHAPGAARRGRGAGWPASRPGARPRRARAAAPRRRRR